ncbi:MAG: hypothetical protein J2P41_07075 [Blastocatellia bacterium]|nr:hypothetical protein [Blastocatellia bacterium]
MHTQPFNQTESADERAAMRRYDDAVLELAATGTVTSSSNIDVRDPIEEEVTKLIALGDRLQRSLQPIKVHVRQWIES